MSIASAALAVAPPKVSTGTPEFRRMQLGLFLGGFATFSLLYCVQPLLPEFTEAFGITAVESAMALSLTTLMLAIAIFLAGAFSQALGRRGLMFISMALAAACNLAAALAPTWQLLLIARAAEGFMLGGVPAVAMAYVSEEMEPHELGSAMGLYVAGNAFGAMMGRVGMGILAEFGSWRWALGVMSAVDLAAAVAFFLLLPPSRHFLRRPGLDPSYHLKTWGAQLRNLALARLFAIGFAVMGVFVTVFNYSGFRLKAPPFSLSQGQSSLIFLVLGFGVVSSSLAGSLADRYGRRTPLIAGFVAMSLGVALTLSASLTLVIAGVVLVTIGFFVAHSVASSWVGRLSGPAKGHAASLYLLFYYLGSAVVGSAGGWFWEAGGWPAVAGLSGGIAAVGALLGLSLRDEAPYRPPLRRTPPE